MGVVDGAVVGVGADGATVTATVDAAVGGAVVPEVLHAPSSRANAAVRAVRRSSESFIGSPNAVL
jgi:hypothetical protein